MGWKDTRYLGKYDLTRSNSKFKLIKGEVHQRCIRCHKFLPTTCYLKDSTRGTGLCVVCIYCYRQSWAWYYNRDKYYQEKRKCQKRYADAASSKEVLSILSLFERTNQYVTKSRHQQDTQ